METSTPPNVRGFMDGWNVCFDVVNLPIFCSEEQEMVYVYQPYSKNYALFSAEMLINNPHIVWNRCRSEDDPYYSGTKEESEMPEDSEFVCILDKEGLRRLGELRDD